MHATQEIAISGVFHVAVSTAQLNISMRSAASRPDLHLIKVTIPVEHLTSSTSFEEHYSNTSDSTDSTDQTIGRWPLNETNTFRAATFTLLAPTAKRKSENQVIWSKFEYFTTQRARSYNQGTSTKKPSIVSNPHQFPSRAFNILPRNMFICFIFKSAEKTGQIICR